MANQATSRVSTLCRVLGVSPSGYYAWRNRVPSRRKVADAELTVLIRKIHIEIYTTLRDVTYTHGDSRGAVRGCHGYHAACCVFSALVFAKCTDTPPLLKSLDGGLGETFL
jgi:hypothetical protein